MIIAILCQIIYARQTANSPNITSDTWPVAISTQLAQCFGIVTACSPQFKPFMDSLRSTGMRIDGMTRYGTSQKGYGSQSASRVPTLHSRSRRLSEIHELVPLPAKDSHHQATVTTAHGTENCLVNNAPTKARLPSALTRQRVVQRGLLDYLHY